MFQTHVYKGGAASFIGAATEAVSVHFNIGDLDGLRTALLEVEVPLTDVDELAQLLTTDVRPTRRDQYSPKVSDWIAKMTRKAADGTWKIGLGAAGGFLSQVLSKYYGFG